MRGAAIVCYPRRVVASKVTGDPRMVFRRCLPLRHAAMSLSVGSGSLTLGHDVLPMVPANDIYHNAPRLRAQLDRDGYLLLKNVIPRDAVMKAFADVAQQINDNGWSAEADREAEFERNGFVYGVPFPAAGAVPPMKKGFHISEDINRVVCGSNVMTVVRQVFGGAVELLNHHSLELSPPGEQHGFAMPSVYANQGTKLMINAWVPLHDASLAVGGLAVVKGSNSSDAFSQVRHTYGQVDVEADTIRGDGCFTRSPEEVMGYGSPLMTSGFEAGDVVLTTVYSMQAFTTNTSRQWRCSASTKWIMEGDDVGADPRYTGARPAGLQRWLAARDDAAKYPRTMDAAKAEWGVATAPPTQDDKDRS
jgi:ectoine hydroxylase-related dioxygenase (phytanoyl-CoA dioxygenase family)